MAKPQHNYPCVGIFEIYNFRRLFLGHHCMYYMLSLFEICLGVEKKMFKEIMNFHYATCTATPNIRTSAPGVLKFTIW